MRKLLIFLSFLLPFTARCQDTIVVQKVKGQVVVIVDKEEVPIPPDPIPLVSVDNVDKNIVYSPAWTHNGSTTASGFYPSDKPTMAYDATAGRTATLLFTGTYLEVFCEKLTGHGSAAFQVDDITPTTVPLGIGNVGGSQSVFKIDNLKPGQHTFKLTIVGGGNVVFDYVKINGQTVTPPVTPIPPDPPSGNVVTVNPGQNLEAIAELQPSGTTVKVNAGTYSVGSIQLPLGVSMSGNQSNVILNYTGPKLNQVETGVIEMKSGSRADGKQTISGFTIKGNGNAAVGVMIDQRDNINVSDIRFEEFNFAAVYYKRCTNVHAFNNVTFNCSWSSAGWASGEFQIMDVNKCSIHHNTSSSDKASEGYFIKAIGSQAPKTGELRELAIYSNNANMFPSSLWNNGQAPNIGIELHDVFYAGIKIYDNIIQNTMSLASHLPPRGQTEVWNNKMDMRGAYAIELVCSDVWIHHNTITNSPMFTANYNPNSQSNGHWTNQLIENNTFTSSGVPGWGGVFLLGMGGADMTIRNNVFNNANGTRVKHTGPTSASNIVQSGNTPPP